MWTGIKCQVLSRKINVLSSSQIYLSWKLWKDSAFLKNENNFFLTKVRARIFILYKQELCSHWIFELASADIQKCNQLLYVLYLTNLLNFQINSMITILFLNTVLFSFQNPYFAYFSYFIVMTRGLVLSALFTLQFQSTPIF